MTPERAFEVGEEIAQILRAYREINGISYPLLVALLRVLIAELELTVVASDEEADEVVSHKPS